MQNASFISIPSRDQDIKVLLLVRSRSLRNANAVVSKKTRIKDALRDTVAIDGTIAEIVICKF